MTWPLKAQPIRRPIDAQQEALLTEELDIVRGMPNGIAYYEDVIANKRLKPENPINSHVMWMLGKVESVRHHDPVRFKPGHVSLPDIDVDIEALFRGRLIQHIREKYGHDCVSNIVTFARMDGKAAVKEIFRILNPVSNSHELANLITSHMIDSAKISDVLEDIREDEPKYNAINYSIDNVAILRDEYYKEYRREFDIAIKIASTIKSKGKHAAGIVIANQPLSNVFPVHKDDKGNLVLALEMEYAEFAGAVKYDFLGVLALDKISAICRMINEGLMEPIINENDEEIEDVSEIF